MFFDINGIVDRELHDMKCVYEKIRESIRSSSKESVEKSECNGRESESLFKCSNLGGVVYYKHVRCKGRQRSIRLGGADNAEVIRLKQIKYNKMMIKVLRKNISLLEKIDGRFINYDPDSIDERIGNVYKDDTGLVNKAPGIVDTEVWDRIVTKNGYKKPEDPNIAPDGMETRSKSEIIVYGIMKGYGLVLKYDMELKLKDDDGEIVTVCPDFVILCFDGSIIIVEHLGMLDKEDYLNNAFRRIHLYLINGYKLNKNLFLTADYAKGKIDAQAVDELVRRMILPRAKGTGLNKQYE